MSLVALLSFQIGLAAIKLRRSVECDSILKHCRFVQIFPQLDLVTDAFLYFERLMYSFCCGLFLKLLHFTSNLICKVT